MREISVIIPTYNSLDALKKNIQAIVNQSYLPNEIIIIDSSNNDKIENYILRNKFNIEIIYRRFKRLFPGEARNIGANIAKFEYLAFLDSKTIPCESWLKINVEYLDNLDLDVVFGSTQYLANSNFQMALIASTYGQNSIETTPGTLISSQNFNLSNGFQEKIRAGEDLYWRQNLKSGNLSAIKPTETTLRYSFLEENIFSSMWKFFLYQISGSKLDIQANPRKIILLFFAIFLAILIPQWNRIVGWEDNVLYIPNITKIYFLTYFVVFLFTFLYDSVINKILSPFVRKLLKNIFLINFFVVVFLWNGSIANWVEQSNWYVPHITKLYISSLFLSSFLYRGIYFPLTNGLSINQLFPFMWLNAGFIGMLLDISKLPGYFLGALFLIFKKN
jgi:glycosyltransferase involved in cell wall biosynthesis